VDSTYSGIAVHSQNNFINGTIVAQFAIGPSWIHMIENRDYKH